MQQGGGLNRAVSALTYGLGCWVWAGPKHGLWECVASLHEEYVNILHVLVAGRVSYLLKLHQITSVTDSEYATEAQLRKHKVTHYLVLYSQSLNSFTFAFRTLPEQQQFKAALALFVREAQLYFTRLTEFDPFKAEAMMTFLEADKDGGNLLDLQEITAILGRMRLEREKGEVVNDMVEIDKYLYERERLKRPRGMGNGELNQLGFQYLLRYYTIKDDLARYFTAQCPNFKLKPRSNKNLIVDIVRHNDKPIMSAYQLQEFHSKVLVESVSEPDCAALIRSFPVYDGEGRERTEPIDMISFNNFCSLLSSRRNSAFREEAKLQAQSMAHPLSDYFVFTDATSHAREPPAHPSPINPYEMSIKRGCRCLRVEVLPNADRQPAVLVEGQLTPPQQLLKIIANKAFQFNNNPLILEVLPRGLDKAALDSLAQAFTGTLDDLLFTLPTDFPEAEALPSPAELARKVLVMASISGRLAKGVAREHPEESMAWVRVVSLIGTRLDFERKGQCCWNYCGLEDDRIRRFEEVEDENISNYTRKVLVRTGPSGQAGQEEANHSCSAALRLGVQFVGLSWAAPNAQNYLLQSWFLEEGGSKGGYLLKPPWMCLRNSKTLYAKNMDVPLFILSVGVVSGQNCAVGSGSPAQRYFLEVSLRGNRREEELSQKYESISQPVAYYSKFELTCEFKVCCPDLTTLLFLVRSYPDGRVLAGRALRVKHLREGLRPVFLLGENFKELPSSYLFINSQRRELPRKHGFHEGRPTH